MFVGPVDESSVARQETVSGDGRFRAVRMLSDADRVGFFRGAEFDAPTRLLEGTGKLVRHVELRPGAGLDAAALTRLVDIAYTDLKMCLNAR